MRNGCVESRPAPEHEACRDLSDPLLALQALVSTLVAVPKPVPAFGRHAPGCRFSISLSADRGLENIACDAAGQHLRNDTAAVRSKRDQVCMAASGLPVAVSIGPVCAGPQQRRFEAIRLDGRPHVAGFSGPYDDKAGLFVEHEVGDRLEGDTPGDDPFKRLLAKRPGQDARWQPGSARTGCLLGIGNHRRAGHCASRGWYLTFRLSVADFRQQDSSPRERFIGCGHHEFREIPGHINPA